jgi:hypothetical protein
MSCIDQTARRYTARLHGVPLAWPKPTLPTFSTLHGKPAPFRAGIFLAGLGEDVKGLQPSGGRTLPLASEVSDHSGEVVDEVLHRSVFTLGLARLETLQGLII